MKYCDGIRESGAYTVDALYPACEKSKSDEEVHKCGNSTHSVDKATLTSFE